MKRKTGPLSAVGERSAMIDENHPESDGHQLGDGALHSFATVLHLTHEGVEFHVVRL